jgi:hypothetical protein
MLMLLSVEWRYTRYGRSMCSAVTGFPSGVMVSVRRFGTTAGDGICDSVVTLHDDIVRDVIGLVK